MRAGLRSIQTSSPDFSRALPLSVPISRVVKSVALVVSVPGGGGGVSAAAPTQRLLLLLHGGQRADLGAVCRAARVPRRLLRMATPSECSQLFGHAPGAMPPLGLRAACSGSSGSGGSGGGGGVPPLRVFADEALLREPGAVLYAGAGARDAHLAMTAADMRAAAGAEPARIAHPPPRSGDGDGDDDGASGGGGGDAPLGETTSSAAAAGAEPSAPPPPPPPPPPPSFALDGGLSKLARWLRCLGIDASAVGDHPCASQIADLASTGRVLLTRSRALAARAACAALLIHADDARAQLQQVRTHFGLSFDGAALLSRCAACNGRVCVAVTGEAAAASRAVPPHVLASGTAFWACDSCGKLFW